MKRKRKSLVFIILFLFVILFVALFFRKSSTIEEIFNDHGFHTEDITNISISSARGNLKQLSEDETNQFVSLLADTEFNKKRIPNIQEFDADIIAFISFSNTDDRLILEFEFERQILGAQIANTIKIEQYLLMDGAELLDFIVDMTK